MALTPQQLHEIAEIIRRHHAAYVVNWFSPQAVPADILDELKQRGLVDPKAETVRDSYLLGQVLAQLQAAEPRKLTYSQLKAHLRNNPMPLSPAERQSVVLATQKAASLVVGLGNRVDVQTGQVLIDVDQKQNRELRQVINEKTVAAISERKTVGELKSDLGHAMQDWTRDLHRIASTEKHTAMEAGKADFFAKINGADSNVAIVAASDCCELCARLTRGPDGAPRIFKLSQLEANGTNYGRKAAECRPVVGAIHPNCFVAGTTITTLFGPKPIEAVQPGDIVLTHLGRWQPVTHTWRSTFSGVMRRLKIGSRTLTVTPNHTFWTGAQWLAADACMKGQSLCQNGGECRAVMLPNSVAANMPAKSADKTFACRVLFGFNREGVPVCAVDLNGQLYIREGDIYSYDATNYKPGLGQKAVLDKVPVHGALKGRAEYALPVGGAQSDSLNGIFLAAPGLIGAGGEGLFFRPVHFGLPVSLPLTPIAAFDASSGQAIADQPTADSEIGGYRFLRESIVNVHFDNAGGVNFAPEHAMFATASISHGQPVQFANAIVNANRCEPFSGDVYNLTVDGDNSYFAEGIAAHNCQCALVPVPEGWGFDKDYELVPDGTLGEHAHAGEIRRSFEVEHDLQKALTGQTKQAALAGVTIKITQPAWSAALPYAKGTFTRGGEVVKCLLGQTASAPNAYVVSALGGDSLLLGFATHDDALLAYTLDKARQPQFAAPTISCVPVTAIGPWANAVARAPTMQLRRAFADDGTVVDVDDVDGGDALSDMPTLGAGSLGTNFAFKVPVKKRPVEKNPQDPTGVVAFIRHPTDGVAVNPVRRKKEAYEISARMSKRSVHARHFAAPTYTDDERTKDIAVARDGLDAQLQARYAGWVGPEQSFVVRDLAGILKEGGPAKRKPVLKRSSNARRKL